MKKPIIVALYKTFDGTEFLHASLASVYSSVQRIVMVHSETSWDGRRGNKVGSPALRWCEAHDEAKKVMHIWGEWDNQEDQYQRGIDWILENMPEVDWIMLVDTDEVWDEENLRRAVRYLIVDGGRSGVVCTRLYTYIKDVHYRIDPPEPLMPVVFFNPKYGEMSGVRGNEVLPRSEVYNVWFHHFSYVRSSDELVFEKIRTSHIGDKLAHVDLDWWRREVWDVLPMVRGYLHTTKGYESCWQGVKVVSDEEVPCAIAA
jgi:hypothetical protein